MKAAGIGRHAPCAIAAQCVVAMAAALLFPAPLNAQDASYASQSSEAQKKAEAVRASAGALFKYWRIPWVTDPAEGFRLAKIENRPVFLYAQVGDPLEDC